MSKKTDFELLRILTDSDPIEDAELLVDCKTEVRRREESEKYDGYFQDFRDKEAEDSITKGEKENPMESIKCLKCKTETVHYKNEKKIKRCLNCNTILRDER